jgi:hypothetical protein
MSTGQKFAAFEVDLTGNNVNGPQSRVEVQGIRGRALKQVVVTHLPPHVDVSLHFGGSGPTFRILKQGDTFEFFDEAERDDGIYWSSEGAWPGYILELAVSFADVTNTVIPIRERPTVRV